MKSAAFDYIKPTSIAQVLALLEEHGDDARLPGTLDLQAERLEKQLAGKIPGEPLRCLPNYRSNDTIRVSDNILLYRSGGNLVYRNDLKSSCPGLARDSDIMVVRQFGSSTCSGDFFHLVDRSSGIRGPTCVFGEFVPYRKPAGDAG